MSIDPNEYTPREMRLMEERDRALCRAERAEDSLAVMQEVAEHDGPYFVMRTRDAAPVEFHGPWDEGADAVNFYNQARLNWSDVFLCAMLRGPRDVIPPKEEP